MPMKPGLKKSLNQTATAGPGYATFVNGMTVIQAPRAMPTLREVDITGISDLGVERLADEALDAILFRGAVIRSILLLVLIAEMSGELRE